MVGLDLTALLTQIKSYCACKLTDARVLLNGVTCVLSKLRRYKNQNTVVNNISCTHAC